MKTLFQGLMFLICCYRAERRKGSIAYTLYLLLNSDCHTAVLAQVTFDFLMLIVSCIPSFGSYIYYPCFGLWPLIICEILVYCWERPDDVIHPCGLPVELKSKYYPFVLVTIFVLIAWSAVYEMTIGLGLGYLRTR